MMERFSADLDSLQRELAEVLQWPKNIGIQFRRLRLASSPAADALLITVDGLASATELSSHVLKRLADFRGAPSPAELQRAITVNRQLSAGSLSDVVEAVLSGHAALLVEGWEQALLLDVVDHPQHHAGQMGQDPHDEAFARDMRANLALIRKRLRDPKLRAFRVELARPRSGGVALIYLEGKASRTVVRAVRLWAHKHAGEEAAARGLMQAAGAVLGLLPRFSGLRWVNKVAMLLDTGYVVLLIDGLPWAYTAPVTYASWLLSPSDYALIYPLKRWLARFRILSLFLVLILPATVVALLNYHQEMVPVGFLLAVASARESAPFGIFFETLGTELLVEIGREAAFRLPVAVPIGLMLVASLLILLISVETGFIGPVPALSSAVGAVLSLTLPSFGGAYMMRLWRFYLMLAAVIIGYFGIAAVLFVLLTYLHQARSWGVPFFHPAGWELSGAEAVSSQRPGWKGGRGAGKGHRTVR